MLVVMLLMSRERRRVLLCRLVLRLIMLKWWRLNRCWRRLWTQRRMIGTWGQRRVLWLLWLVMINITTIAIGLERLGDIWDRRGCNGHRLLLPLYIRCPSKTL